MSAAQFRLQMRDVTKSYGPTEALRGVGIDVVPGEIHAVVGENGAGKSTLMKIISGAEQPDQGTMFLDGAPFSPCSPLDARDLGVAMIYQELTLAPHLSVEANIMLGRERRLLGFIRKRSHYQRVSEVLRILDHEEIRPGASVRRLRPAGRQLVEIARALVENARVLIFDEPTSSLTNQDAQRLFALMGRLRDKGVSILYISHHLEEVQQVADRFTVLRDGQAVATGFVNQTRAEKIVEWMVGRRICEIFSRKAHQHGQTVLRVDRLAGEKLPRGVSLELHRSEVAGIFGLVGSGRTEFLRTLYGLDRQVSGKVELNGRLAFHACPAERIEAGMGFLSEDRKNEGLAISQSILENLTAPRLRPYSRLGLLNNRRRRQAAQVWASRMNIKCRGPSQKVAQLSGGNQQKVAVARLLHQEAEIYLLDEPTRGIDVGSKMEIYRLIDNLAREGKAILFVSSYLPELMGVCDRLGVMVRGRIEVMRPIGDWTEESILEIATNGGAES